MAPKNMKIVCGDGHHNRRSWLLLPIGILEEFCGWSQHFRWQRTVCYAMTLNVMPCVLLHPSLTSLVCLLCVLRSLGSGEVKAV